MACTDHHREIDDKPVYVKQWAASKSLENLGKALSIFGANFAPFVDGDFHMGDIVILLSNDPKKTMDLIKDFNCAARIDGHEVTLATFNKEYNGELLYVFKIFSFVCEVQYKDFFEQGQTLSPQPIETTPTTTTTP